MTDSKRIACLANSRKLTGRCVAGREIKGRKGGKWIRPVSSRPGREVDEYERQYEDGSDPCVLDIIRIPVKEPIPEAWQTENWLLHPEYYWKKEGTWSWFDLSALLDPSPRSGSTDTTPSMGVTTKSRKSRCVWFPVRCG